ncbi:MAG: hypothetical protein IH846_01870 [Acidobacteria bacterium]|nr:hypothetical protein [Acidobacteriota bacterium]
MEFLIPALRSHKSIRQPASPEINFSGNFPEKSSGKLGPALQGVRTGTPPPRQTATQKGHGHPSLKRQGGWRMLWGASRMKSRTSYNKDGLSVLSCIHPLVGKRKTRK